MPRKPKKQQTTGTVTVQMADLAYMTFTSMDFWKAYIPEGCSVVQVQICHDYGCWDEDPDTAYFNIDWVKDPETEEQK